MASSIEVSAFDGAAFDRATDPVFQILTVDQARQVVQYQADEQLRQRIEQLAAKCNEGELTPAERAEYEGYVRANKFIALMQAKARKMLSATF